MERFIPSLTGIRAVAALWVLIGHYSSFLFEDFGLSKETPLSPFLLSAWAGVDLFFVLSGFIITHNYAQTWDRSLNHYLKFLAKRVARLYPVYLVTTLIAAAFYGIAILVGHQFNNQSAQDLSIGIFLANLVAIQQWLDINSLNGPAWSVSAEFFAYIVVFPILMLFSLNTRGRLVNWVVGIGCIVALVFLPKLESLNSELWQVTFEFVLGSSAYKLASKFQSRKTSKSLPFYRLLTWSAALTAIYFHEDFDAHFLVALFSAISITLYSLSGDRESLLAKPIMVRLGYWSFSLYLVHRLIQNFVSGLGGVGSNSWLLNFVTFALLLGAAVGLAGAMFKFVEEPGRRVLNRLFLRWLDQAKP